jgi:hypothetical protein
LLVCMEKQLIVIKIHKQEHLKQREKIACEVDVKFCELAEIFRICFVEINIILESLFSVEPK